MRATVWLTVGPLWCRRSAMRARSGTIPSSSSSKIVRRYISVVSMRSFTGTPPCRRRVYGGTGAARSAGRVVRAGGPGGGSGRPRGR